MDFCKEFCKKLWNWYSEHKSLGLWVICPIGPGTQLIILKIDRFQIRVTSFNQALNAVQCSIFQISLPVNLISRNTSLVCYSAAVPPRDLLAFFQLLLAQYYQWPTRGASRDGHLPCQLGVIWEIYIAS